jgi:hypothetical protein
VLATNFKSHHSYSCIQPVQALAARSTRPALVPKETLAAHLPTTYHSIQRLCIGLAGVWRESVSGLSSHFVSNGARARRPCRRSSPRGSYPQPRRPRRPNQRVYVDWYWHTPAPVAARHNRRPVCCPIASPMCTVMPQRPTQYRRSTIKNGDAVGRCCQRHITGQVMTDWYPAGIHAELVDNRCCRGVHRSLTHGTVHRRPRRRTVSPASDKFPEQSEPLCAGNIRLVSHHNCNFRLAVGSEYVARHPENRGPGPGEGDGQRAYVMLR